MRRLVESGWPALLLCAACAGLTLSVWLRLPAVALLPAACAAATGALLGRDLRRLALAGLALAILGLWWGALRETALDRSVLASHLGERLSARVVVTGPVRRTQFALRAPAQVVRFGDQVLRELSLIHI